MKKGKKQVILIRHGHRDKSLGYHRDNGLDEKGIQQAEAFKNYFLTEFKNIKPKLFSSPKTRCLETLEPLAKALGLAVEIEEGLIEQDLKEGPEHFLNRVQNYCDKIKAASEPLQVFCSHGDWLPLAVWVFTGHADPFKKGEHRLIDL